MTFALSYHSNVPSLLTQPRLFLGPELPGYVSSKTNTVLFPMTLDGTMTDTGVVKGNINGVARFLDRHQHRFVSSSSRAHIYSSPEFYEASVHPGWLTSIAHWIDDDRARYGVFPNHPFQRIVQQAIKGQMRSLQPLLSACLYLGDGDITGDSHFLYPHDLALYGHPVRVDQNHLYPALKLLETFCLTLEQIRAGVAEKIVLHKVNRTVSFHDVETLTQTHGNFIEFARRQGDVVAFLRDDVRPETEGIEDANGNLNPARLEGHRVHPAYASLQNEMADRAAVFLGFLLLVHYEIDGSLMEALIRRLESVSLKRPLISQEHLQSVLETEMFELGHNLSRDEAGFEGRCLLAGLQTLTRIL